MLEDAVKAELMSKLKQISEDNNDEPIYNSFVRWVCENYLDIDDDDDIADIISVGGKYDYDVDYFVHKDNGTNDESYMAWGQVKFSETFDKVVVRNEMETFGKTLIYLQDCPENANNTFKGHSKIFNELGGKNAHIRKKMTFIVAGTLNEDVELLLDSKDWSKNFVNEKGPQIDFQIITIDKIIDDLIRPKIEPLSIKFDGMSLEKEDKSTGNKSIIGFVKASDITSIVKQHPGLFGLNIRQSLGKQKPAYKGMTNTLNDSKKKKQFWKFNNGITAVCKSFEKQNIHGLVSYVVEDLQIVNGRQTTYCLFENSEIDSKILDDDVLVSVRIHQTESKQEASEITSSTNTQNTVKEVDQISNFEEIEALAIQCRHRFPDFYFERQTAGFGAASKNTRNKVTRKRLLDKEKSARSYLAYSNNEPNSAIIPSKDLFSMIDPTYYNAVFANRAIEELIIPHIFTYMLNSLDLKWGNEHRNKNDANYYQKQILHKEIVKYFMLDLIGRTMRDLKDSDRIACQEKLIDMMKKLNTKDSVPSKFLEIAVVTLDYFMYLFNANKLFTWPDHLIEKIKTPGYVSDPYDKPDHDDIRRKLIGERGTVIRSIFMDTIKEDMKIGRENPIKDVILRNLK
jgi:hypothetical protein